MTTTRTTSSWRNYLTSKCYRVNKSQLCTLSKREVDALMIDLFRVTSWRQKGWRDNIRTQIINLTSIKIREMVDVLDNVTITLTVLDESNLCKLNIIFIHTFLYYLNDSASRHGKALSLGIWRDFPHLFVSVSYLPVPKNRLLLHNSMLRLLSSKNVKVIVTSTI